jgi:hypothetical protein
MGRIASYIDCPVTHVDVQDLADSAREAALRRVGRALHEHDEGVVLDRLESAPITIAIA